MRNVDFSTLYRNSIGFDRFASILDASARRAAHSSSYPPFNVEVIGENEYNITMAIAGFSVDDIEIQSEHNVLTISGKKPEEKEERKYLHRGLANRNFEQKFELADHVKVKNANMENGLLHIELERVVPEALKPRTIKIQTNSQAIAHDSGKEQAA